MDSELLRRQEEGRILKREDQLTDISQLPESVLTGKPASDFKDSVKIQTYTPDESSDKGSTMGSLSMDNVAAPIGEGYYGNTNVAQDELLSRSPVGGKRGSLEYLGSEEKNLDNSNPTRLIDQTTAKISELRGQAGAKIHDLKEGYHNLGTQFTEKVESAKEQIANFNMREAPHQIKQQLVEKGKDLKQGAKDLYKEASEKYVEIKEQMEQKEKELQQQAQELSSRASEKIDTAKEQLEQHVSQDSSSKVKGAQDYKEQLHNKNQKLKEGLEDKQENLRQQVQGLSEKSSQKVSEIKQQFNESKEQFKQQVQNLPEKAMDKAQDLKQAVNEKVEGFKQASQSDSNQAHSPHHLSTESPSFTPSQENHSQQQHHLSADSQSFRPNQESHVLVEAVKEGLGQRSGNLVEKVNEAEEQLQASEVQNEIRKESAPAITKQWRQYLYQESAREWNQSIKEGKFELVNQPQIQQKQAFVTPSQASKKEWTNRWSQRRVQPRYQRKSDKLNRADRKPQQQKQSQKQTSNRRRSQKVNRYLYKETSHHWNMSLRQKQSQLNEKSQTTQESLPSKSNKKSRQWTNRWSQRRDQPKNQRRNQGKQTSQDLSQRPQDSSKNSQEYKQRPRQHKQRSYQRRPQYMKIYQVKEAPKKEKQTQMEQQSEETQNEISKDQQFMRTESGSESQTERERVPLLDVVQNKYQNYKNKINNVVHFFKGDKDQEGNFESKTSGSFEEQQPEGSSSKEKINEQVGRISNKISGQVESVKAQVNQKASEQSERLTGLINDQLDTAKTKFSQLSKNECSVAEGSAEASDSQGLSLRGKVSSGLHNITSKLTHSFDGVKDRLYHSKDQIGSDLRDAQESKQALAARVKNEFNTASNELTDKVTNMKDKFKKDNTNEDIGEFHVVKDGFSETVDELHKEQHVEEYAVPPHSDNPFDALIGEKNLVQPLKDTDIVGGNVQELAEGIKDDDLIHQEVQEVQAKTGILGKISANISNISHKITAKLPENIKHPFTSSEKINKENTDEYL